VIQVFLLTVKFALIIILYIFIIKVFRVIITDLRRTSGRSRSGMAPAVSGAELVVTASSDPVLRQGEVIRLNRQTRIGRGPQNDINLSDSFISHDHAQINFYHDKFQLEDLDSINGTYINGVRVVEPVVLGHGDTIRVAGITFKFVRWEYEVE